MAGGLFAFLRSALADPRQGDQVGRKVARVRHQ
jgi:hypothetical protein